MNLGTLEELEKTMGHVKSRQPQIKFNRSKRSLFTDEVIKQKRNSPSPGQYNADESKVYKVMAKARR